MGACVQSRCSGAGSSFVLCSLALRVLPRRFINNNDTFITISGCKINSHNTGEFQPRGSLSYRLLYMLNELCNRRTQGAHSECAAGDWKISALFLVHLINLCIFTLFIIPVVFCGSSYSILYHIAGVGTVFMYTCIFIQ